MAQQDVRRVVDTWAEETEKLGASYQWVQIFENRGEMMGASNPHPHGQIWAGDALPVEATREDASQRKHMDEHRSPLLADYAAAEIGGPREVVASDDWLVVVPFWAVWPFETLLIPRQVTPRLSDLGDRQKDSLTDVLQVLITIYDRLFECDFPYSMGWHGAPFTHLRADHWTVHAHFYPPLLRSSAVRKFMVGYELLAEAQRDITAEEAAGRLRKLTG
jgi:UDPglucose--hexose-1-phosphate uridylyltransferase